MKTLARLFILLVILLGTIASTWANQIKSDVKHVADGFHDGNRPPEAAVSDSNEALATRRFRNVHIRRQSIASLLSDFSLSYDVPLGLEIALSDDEVATYGIDFKEGTLSELLTRFVTQHNQYTWEISDGVVNVFPRKDQRDGFLNTLLSTKIRAFSIKENTSSWSLQESLASTPEIKTVQKSYAVTPSGFNFAGLYFPQLGRNFRLNVSEVTVKSILGDVKVCV